jgi:hypothetical protein
MQANVKGTEKKFFIMYVENEDAWRQMLGEHVVDYIIYYRKWRVQRGAEY